MLRIFKSKFAGDFIHRFTALKDLIFGHIYNLGLDAQEAAGGEVIYAGVANPTDEEIAKIPTDLYREGYAYYYRTHAHPNSTFKYTMSSLMDLMTFDASTIWI